MRELKPGPVQVRGRHQEVGPEGIERGRVPGQGYDLSAFGRPKFCLADGQETVGSRSR